MFINRSDQPEITAERMQQLYRNPRQQFGIHFPEENGEGYLLIRELATGINATTALVLSLSDNEVYVRRQDRRLYHGIDDVPEVSHLIDHHNVPRLVSYSSYRISEEDPASWKSLTYWEYCNGGDLMSFTDNFSPVRQRERNVFHGFELNNQLPDAFLLKFFRTMLSILMENFRRGVVHNMIHMGNIFLHWRDEQSSLPEIFLGDYSDSYAYPWSNHPVPQYQKPFLATAIPKTDPIKHEQHLINQARTGSLPPNVAYKLPPRAVYKAILSTEPDDTFNPEPLKLWYSYAISDVRQTLQVIADLVRAQYNYFTEQTEYFHKLDRHDPNLPPIWLNLHILARHIDSWELQCRKDTLNPSQILNSLNVLKSRLDQELRNTPDPKGATVLRLTRPAPVLPCPAVWPSQGMLKRQIQHDPSSSSSVTIFHPIENRKIHVDHGQYRIVRLESRGPDLGWRIIESDGFRDSEDSNDQNDPDVDYVDTVQELKWTLPPRIPPTKEHLEERHREWRAQRTVNFQVLNAEIGDRFALRLDDDYDIHDKKQDDDDDDDDDDDVVVWTDAVEY